MEFFPESTQKNMYTKVIEGLYDSTVLIKAVIFSRYFRIHSIRLSYSLYFKCLEWILFYYCVDEINMTDATFSFFQSIRLRL